MFRRHLALCRYQYSKASLSGDVRSALACLQEIAKVAGLYDLEFAKKIAELEALVAKLIAEKQGQGNRAGG